MSGFCFFKRAFDNSRRLSPFLLAAILSHAAHAQESIVIDSNLTIGEGATA